MPRPKGARNKHPSTLTIQIQLNTKGDKKMENMTINELGKHIERSHNALVKLEECVSALSNVLEISEAMPDLKRVVDSLKYSKQGYLDEWKKRTDFKKQYDKVIFDVTMKYSAKPENIAAILENEQQSVKQRREKFQQAGMSSADSIAFVPDFDPTARLAEIEKRHAIADGWKKFAATGLEADLPENAAEMLDAFGVYEEFTPRGVVGRPTSVFD